MRRAVTLKVDATLLAMVRRAAAAGGRSLTSWWEEAAREKLQREGIGMVCAVCGRPLDPASAVYLGFGKRHDGKPGPGWVLALCPATPAEVTAGTGSACVAAARRRLGDALVPSSYEEWLGEK